MGKAGAGGGGLNKGCGDGARRRRARSLLGLGILGSRPSIKNRLVPAAASRRDGRQKTHGQRAQSGAQLAAVDWLPHTAIAVRRAYRADHSWIDEQLGGPLASQ